MITYVNHTHSLSEGSQLRAHDISDYIAVEASTIVNVVLNLGSFSYALLSTPSASKFTPLYCCTRSADHSANHKAGSNF